MSEPAPVLVVLVTCPVEAADALAGALIATRVAACVNVVPKVTSTYRWQGKVQNDAESLLIVKTAPDRFVALKQAVLDNHPSELPEVIALPVVAGHAPYLDWVVTQSKPEA